MERRRYSRKKFQFVNYKMITIYNTSFYAWHLKIRKIRKMWTLWDDGDISH